MEYCLADAREKGKSGICMLGAKKQKNWLSDQSFAKKFGFEVVDTTDNGYELLALSFDGKPVLLFFCPKHNRFVSGIITERGIFAPTDLATRFQDQIANAGL